MKSLSGIELPKKLSGMFRKAANEPLTSQSSLTFRDEEYWVGFTNGDPHWLKPMLRKGFEHCFVIKRDENGHVIILDPTRAQLEISVSRFHEPLELAKISANSELRLLNVVINRTNLPEKSQFYAPFTCVSFVKYVLGLKFKPYQAQTPYQLYKLLCAGKHPAIKYFAEITL